MDALSKILFVSDSSRHDSILIKIEQLMTEIGEMEYQLVSRGVALRRVPSSSITSSNIVLSLRFFFALVHLTQLPS
jgi:hypothetical protein